MVFGLPDYFLKQFTMKWTAEEGKPLQIELLRDNLSTGVIRETHDEIIAAIHEFYVYENPETTKVIETDPLSIYAFTKQKLILNAHQMMETAINQLYIVRHVFTSDDTPANITEQTAVLNFIDQLGRVDKLLVDHFLEHKND